MDDARTEMGYKATMGAWKRVIHGKSRRTMSPEFKAKVALEAIRGVTTVNEIMAIYKVHPNQITKWKKRMQDNMATLFTDGRVHFFIKGRESLKNIKSVTGPTRPMNIPIGMVPLNASRTPVRSTELNPAIRSVTG